MRPRNRADVRSQVGVRMDTSAPRPSECSECQRTPHHRLTLVDKWVLRGWLCWLQFTVRLNTNHVFPLYVTNFRICENERIVYLSVCGL